MPSKRKSEAARANGAKSRGPKTPVTREKSSRNSLRHGLTARNTIVLEYESHEEFQQMLTEYRKAHAPGNAIEMDLVDQMVAARWRVRRLWTIETALLDTEIVLRQPELKKQFKSLDGAIELAMAFRSLVDDSTSLALATRYESRLHRMYERAHRTLRRLQRERWDSNIKFDKTNPTPHPLENQ